MSGYIIKVSTNRTHLIGDNFDSRSGTNIIKTSKSTIPSLDKILVEATHHISISLNFYDPFIEDILYFVALVSFDDSNNYRYVFDIQVALYSYIR